MRVIFLGARGNDVELMELVKSILEEHGDPLVVNTDVRREETLFAAAEVVPLLQGGDRYGFDACLVPDRCENAYFDDNGDEIESKVIERPELLHDS